VLAHPAEPRARGPSLVHHGLDVYADLALRAGPLLPDPGEQLSQLVADHVVIVVAPAVARELARPGVFRVAVRRVVVDGDGDDGAGAGQQGARVRAPFRVALHPAHLAVQAAPEPFAQALPLGRERERADDADLVAAQGESALLDSPREGRGL
jgi:hypothetical protein